MTVAPPVTSANELTAVGLRCYVAWQDRAYAFRPKSLIARLRETGCLGVLVNPTATIYPFTIPSLTLGVGRTQELGEGRKETPELRNPSRAASSMKPTQATTILTQGGSALASSSVVNAPAARKLFLTVFPLQTDKFPTLREPQIPRADAGSQGFNHRA